MRRACATRLQPHVSKQVRFTRHDKEAMVPKFDARENGVRPFFFADEEKYACKCTVRKSGFRASIAPKAIRRPAATRPQAAIRPAARFCRFFRIVLRPTARIYRHNPTGFPVQDVSPDQKRTITSVRPRVFPQATDRAAKGPKQEAERSIIRKNLHFLAHRLPKQPAKDPYRPLARQTSTDVFAPIVFATAKPQGSARPMKASRIRASA